MNVIFSGAFHRKQANKKKTEYNIPFRKFFRFVLQ